jgi:hypothetical protein
MWRDIRAEGVYTTLALLGVLELFWEEDEEEEEIACNAVVRRD